MNIIISPYSSRLRSGKTNPKNFPHWLTLVRLLNREGYRVTQIGATGEEKIDGVGQLILNASYPHLKELAKDCGAWISVDNFFPHFCHANKLRGGIVLWGPSDPQVWGYKENINLLRGRDFLRKWQFQTWEEFDHNPLAFIYAENVMPHIYKLAPLPPRELVLTSHVPITTAQSA